MQLTLLNEEEDEEDDVIGNICSRGRRPIEFVKWLLCQCTMANPGDMLHCYYVGATRIWNPEAWMFCFAMFQRYGLTEVQENVEEDISSQGQPAVLYISLHIHEGGETSVMRLGQWDEGLLCKCFHGVGGGVGDIIYNAFQQVVIPIARGDPLECCDVITPAGYSRMTQMLGDLCGGKMLLFSRAGVLMDDNPENECHKRLRLQELPANCEKEACSGPYMGEMESKEALYNQDKKEASYSAATHQKELMEQAIGVQQDIGMDELINKNNASGSGNQINNVMVMTLLLNLKEQRLESVAMCTSHSKKKMLFHRYSLSKLLPQSSKIIMRLFGNISSLVELSLVPTKYTLWNLFHHALSNTEDIQSSAVDLLTYTSQASLFEIYTRFTVLNVLMKRAMSR
ncbi:hypothetical protein HID58_004019 [Brassica napus]|uniref:Uncharacterized protein n=1 Tax=Brassica napus TaxID=3708 RepID=A0ABQ7XIF0_BRANA|nr:hypothetical protein HID58_004019 [Brassica napus]